MKYDYLVVGAGLYGSTIARLLTDKGKSVLVIEKESNVGGKCYTKNIDGITVHVYGAHIFHTSSKEVWDFVNKYCHMKNYVHQVKAYNSHRLYSLPFNMNTFYEVYGFTTPEQVKHFISKQYIKNPSTLEEQATSFVGKKMFNLLIKYYTEKQWNKSCKDLSKDIIKRIPVRYTFNNNYFNDIYQGIPEEGYTKMIENMLDGIEVKCNVLNYKSYFSKAKKIIYTGKLDELFDYRLGRLDYRCLNFITEVKDTDNFQGCPVLNYTDNKHKYTRIIEHKHFLNDVSDKTIITYEYPSDKGLECYPINNEKNNNLHAEYKQLLPENIYIGGRLAEYKYYDMDDIIEKAMKDSILYE